MTGGTEIQTLNLVQALVAGGYRVVTTCYFEYSDDMVVRFRKAGSEVVCLSPTGTRVNGWRGILFLYKGLRRVLKQYKPDVVHVQYMAPGAIPILLLRWLGPRHIRLPISILIYGWYILFNDIVCGRLHVLPSWPSDLSSGHLDCIMRILL